MPIYVFDMIEKLAFFMVQNYTKNGLYAENKVPPIRPSIFAFFKLNFTLCFHFRSKSGIRLIVPRT